MYTLAFTGFTLVPYILGAAVLTGTGLVARAKGKRQK